MTALVQAALDRAAQRARGVRVLRGVRAGLARGARAVRPARGARLRARGGVRRRGRSCSARACRPRARAAQESGRRAGSTSRSRCCLLAAGARAAPDVRRLCCSPFYPLMYAFVAFVAAFAERASGARASWPARSASRRCCTSRPRRTPIAQPFVLHAGLLALFGLLNAAFDAGRDPPRAHRQPARAARREACACARTRACSAWSRRRPISRARRRAHDALERGGSAPGAVLQPRLAAAHAALALVRAARCATKRARSCAWSSSAPAATTSPPARSGPDRARSAPRISAG